MNRRVAIVPYLAVAILSAVATAGLIGLAKVARPAHFHEDALHEFVPEAASYMAGDFQALAQVGDAEPTITGCLSTLQRLIGAAEQNGQVPTGGAVIGLCAPVPKNYTGVK